MVRSINQGGHTMTGFWETILLWFGLAPYTQVLKFEDTNEVLNYMIRSEIERHVKEKQALLNHIKRLQQELDDDPLRIEYDPDYHSYGASIVLDERTIIQHGIKGMSEEIGVRLAHMLMEYKTGGKP
jgi:hypothetical protein